MKSVKANGFSKTLSNIFAQAATSSYFGKALNVTSANDTSNLNNYQYW